VKRTESTSYLLVRKLARRGSAEGYRTNRSRIYSHNSSYYAFWLLRLHAWKIKTRHACPRWPSFCWVCSFYPHPNPVMLSVLSLLSSFSFPLVVPAFSISLSPHRFLPVDPCLLWRDCSAGFTTDPAVGDMALGKENVNYSFFFDCSSSSFVFSIFSRIADSTNC